MPTRSAGAVLVLCLALLGIPARATAAPASGAAASASPASPASPASEEKKLIEISKLLKPIPNNQWNEIVGAKIKDTYEVVKGDTLWDISKRLFGNAYYWPKIWSLNRGIANPHIIEPGQKLVFTPGTSENLPKLSPDSTPPMPGGGTSTSAPLAQADTGGTAYDSAPSGPREYDRIPKDKWVHVPPSVLAQNANYDELGFAKDIRQLAVPTHFTFRVPAIANDTTVPYLGVVVATRRDGDGISQHDTVFLKSNSQDLQVGTSYTVFSDPEYVREKKSDRGGYIYDAVAEIKIIGVRDELYVGIITTSYGVVTRGMKVYPLLPLVNDIKPLPARTAVESLVMLDSSTALYNTAQYRIIHFDRGIEDGVQVGNVFRIYDYYDPVTHLKITDSDFLVNADALVIHATAQFSTALVINGHDIISRGNFGVLLTDVSDITRERDVKPRDMMTGPSGTPEDQELDELDELDKATGEGLGRKEESEIKELDQWDKSKDLKTEPEPTQPSAAETPTDEMEKTPSEKQAPQDPSLDQTLDSPAVTPQGLETPPPPAHLKPAPEQTLEAPPPPESQRGSMPGEPSPGPNVEPINPPESGTVEPAVPAPPDDTRSQ